MIYKIAIENFFSIAARQELDLPIADNVPILPCFVPPLLGEDMRLPTVVGLFGANASGKSTVLRAIVSTALFAMFSVDWGVKDIGRFFQSYRTIKWLEKPSIISIEFDSQLNPGDKQTKFRYELHVNHDPGDYMNKIVIYEALFYSPKGKIRSLFERKNQLINFGKDFGITNSDSRKDYIRSDASVISTLAKFNHQPSMHLCKLVNEIRTNSIGFDRIQQSPNQWLTVYANDKKCLERLNNELKKFDVGLEYMAIEQGNQGLFAKFKHNGLDNFILYEEESAGTQRFIEMFLRLHYALEKGSIAIIDEIDSDLHPFVLPEILRWFSNKDRNPYNAQLFFTAHNPALLEDLEKEQVFFTEKPLGKSTRIYGARNIKGLRREPNLMKKYLAGELGAVPHIG